MPTPLKIILYPIATLFFFAVFFVLLFPFDSVKTRLSRELEQRLGGEYAITIGHLSPSPLSGAVLKDVEIRLRSASGGEALKISKAKLKFALLSLLSGGMEVDFDLRSAAAGRAIGSFSRKRGGGIGLDLKMNRFDLALFTFLAQKAGLPMTGLVNGEMQMEIYPQDPLRNSGKISLEMPDLRLGEVVVKEGIFRLPPMRLAGSPGTPSKVEVVINRGNFEVKGIQFSGGDLELATDGKIYGARRMENYRFNLKGSFRISQEAAAQVPFLMAVEKQKLPDGTYPFTITGRISKPNIRIGEFKVPI